MPSLRFHQSCAIFFVRQVQIYGFPPKCKVSDAFFCQSPSGHTPRGAAERTLPLVKPHGARFPSLGRVYSLVYSFSMRKGRAESPTAAFSPGHRPGLGHSTMIVRPERAKARPNRWGFFKYNGVGRAFALTGRKVNELA